MKLLKRSVLLVLFLSMAAVLVQAQQSVGKLILETGQLKLRHLGLEQVYDVAGKEYPVFNGDVVQTGAASRARLLFRGKDEEIKLFARTNFKINQVTEKESSFGLNVGKSLFNVFARLRKRQFKVRTSTATIGIKGTEFVVGTDGVNTYLVTLRGLVKMANVDLPDVEVEVGANQASTVAPSEPPTPPVEVSQEVQEQILNDEGLQGMDDVSPPPTPTTDTGSSEEGSSEETPTEIVETVDTVQDVIATTVEEATPSGDTRPADQSINISITR